MKATRIIFILAALGVAASAQPNSNSAAEQRVFNLVDVVNRRELLSAAELAALANDDLMRKQLAAAPSGSKLTQDGLEAAVVHLCGAAERDLIVIGDGDPYAGANAGPFWIIRDLPAGPVVVLGESSLSLSIEAKRLNKCLNVAAFAATTVDGTTTEYRFNGDKYIVSSQKTKKLAQ